MIGHDLFFLVRKDRDDVMRGAARVKFGKCSRGVGRWAMRIRGKRARFMFAHIEKEEWMRQRKVFAIFSPV